MNVGELHSINCCGCSACAQKCPLKCIRMTEDMEGFQYPEVDKSVCVDCGLCVRCCPVVAENPSRLPLKVLAAINRNLWVIQNSSSGGVFYELSKQVLSENGVVFGARFDENWRLVIDYADTLESIKQFMGSKYIQAISLDSYIKVESFLKQGRFVLYSGTPCQVHGLIQFLGKSYKNLITVDFICHGVPSPLVWRRYLSEVTPPDKSIKSISFRNKSRSWQDFMFSIKFTSNEGDSELLESTSENVYMKAFLENLTLRPSCYNCSQKCGRSCSDFTLGDFWGAWNLFPDLPYANGVSSVLLNSEAAIELYEKCNLQATVSDIECIKQYNSAYNKSVVPHKKRKYFFKQIQSIKHVKPLISRILYKNYFQRILESIIYRIKHLK